MTFEVPPSWLENSALHRARGYRQLLGSLLGSGVSGVASSGALAVTEKSGTPTMSVDVAAGGCVIASSRSTAQGTYHAYNDAVVNVPLSAADATNPRIDRVLVQVRDEEQDAGLTDNDVRIFVEQGTPAASPTVPTISVDDYLELAQVLVPASATSITNSDITDKRRQVVARGGVLPCTATTRPSSPFVGQQIYETDTGNSRLWNGSSWVLLPGRHTKGTAASISTNASGYYTITHGLGTTPSQVFCQSRGPASGGTILGLVLVSAVNSTTITVRCFEQGGAVLTSASGLSIDWQAWA